ncbi:unnamed protein product [Sphagnum troendelagicum]|uniref:Uncharacterized protein n=1 Tax=Sphagnum troendelagicum TaxID=128251 RepID=A0ABP0UDD0_9BRYO
MFLPIHLSIAPVLSLIEKKPISLGKKCLSIPLEHLPYYPKIPSALCVQIDDDQKQEPPTTRKKKQQLVAIDAMVELAPNTLTPLAPVKVKPGCPKKKVVTASGSLQKLILQFFSK